MPKWLWAQEYNPPAWSPDGSLLAVLDENPNSKSYGDLYVVRPDGTSLSRVTFTGGDLRKPEHSDPAWLPAMP